jgi:hypothetical protein
MPNEDPRSTALLRRGPKAYHPTWVLMAILMMGVLGVAVFAVSRADRTAKAPRGGAFNQPTTSNTVTSVDEQGELVARLKEILAARERAYRTRDPEILKKIYTVDCPCLESDTNAIRELIDADYVWVGGRTSVRIRRTEQVTTRMWTLVADFSSEDLRIQTRSGQLIRSEPKGRSLFQFILARPIGSTEWLLGRAIAYKGG